MCVAGVGLVKVYKALIRLVRGAHSLPLLMSMLEAFPLSAILYENFATQKAPSNQVLFLTLDQNPFFQRSQILA